MTGIKISLESIKKIRELTGVGVQEAQKVLTEASGDMEKAQAILRRRGVAVAAKKADRKASEGLVHAYVHGRKVGVIVEVNCETDFVAKTEDFQNFVHEIALQIAALAPRFISRSEVPAEVLEKEKAMILERHSDKMKSADMMEKIQEGELEKFFGEICLLNQPSVKDPKITVKQMLTDAIARFGENIVISRFTRYQLGE
ncbi:MAG: translation elongation factor Ts [Patescibacteria group bacterium]